MDNIHFGFSILQPDNEMTIANVSELNTILNSLGISFSVEPYEKDTGLSAGYFSIAIDMDTLQKKMTRNAGRKVNYKKSLNYKVCPTIGEVFAWKQTMTHEQIIDKIGCPRATYYRRLRELSESWGLNYSDFDPNDSWLKNYFL